MNWFSKLGLKKSLIISMLAVGVLPLVLGSLFVLMQAKAGLERQAFNQLVSIREARGGQVEDYFETIAGQSRTMAETTTVIEAAKAFRSAFHQLPDELDLNQEELAQERETLSEYYLGAFASQYAKINAANIDAQPLIPTDPVSVIAQYRYIADNPNPLGLKDKLDTGADDTAYSRAHAKYHPIFRSFLHEFGFYDVFIVDPETGHIVYSVFKELDFATSLKTGVYSQTNFADAFRAAAEAGQGGEPILVDFAPYKPSYEAAASFISQPVFDGNTLVGVLIFQMPVGRINKMMNAAAGMGETGETYLIGPDNRLRSQSRFSDKPTILIKEVRRDDVNTALGGDVSTMAVNAVNGTELLASASPLAIAGLDWAVVAQIASDEALSTITTLQCTTLITLAITIAAIVAFAMWFSGKIYRQLGGDPSIIERVARLIGAGRLSRVGDSMGARPSGALGELHDMQIKLTGIIAKAKDTAERVRNGASELSQGNKGLSQRTEEQAAGLEETATSMEEITSTVKQTAENTRQAKELADSAKEQAEHGGLVVTSTIDAIAEIDASSEKIASIIKVIDDIAFQTNLLALNASVEAARAGEQGQAFGVVADEVRKLAGRSASSAKEIKALIEDSVGKVKTGRRLASESGESLRDILASIQKVADIVNEISTAGLEQSAGIEQINQAVMHLDSTTQQNAELVGKAALTSEAMFSQAASLAEVMSFFEVDAPESGSDSEIALLTRHTPTVQPRNSIA